VGLGHGGARDCRQTPISGDCFDIEYGDPNSVMGNSETGGGGTDGVSGGVPAQHRWYMNWMAGRWGEVSTNPGTYRLAPLELQKFEPGRPTLQALRINDEVTLWVDAENETGAVGLYERVGMRAIVVDDTYQLELA